jgi:hypothetical protein
MAANEQRSIDLSWILEKYHISRASETRLMLQWGFITVESWRAGIHGRRDLGRDQFRRDAPVVQAKLALNDQ